MGGGGALNQGITVFCMEKFYGELIRCIIEHFSQVITFDNFNGQGIS